MVGHCIVDSCTVFVVDKSLTIFNGMGFVLWRQNGCNVEVVEIWVTW
jgi:hypothetical protein